MIPLNDTMGLIVDRIKSQNIQMWDVYCKLTDIYENQFRQYDLEITRHAFNSYYIIRTFHVKDDQFGVGVVKANSLDPSMIDQLIKESQKLAKLNISSKYDLPQPGQSYPKLKLAEEKVVNDPEAVLKEKTEELQNLIQDLKHVHPTFGKLRIYVSSNALRNCEGISLNDLKTTLYLELPLKAEENGKLAEFWGRSTVKNSNQLDLPHRLANWAELAVDSLKAEVPSTAKSVDVIFPPNVLQDAFFKTLGTHSTGRALAEKISRFKPSNKVANENFSLTDNGLLEEGTAIANWDGEGNPHRHNFLIEKGIFLNFLFDQKYAALQQTQSTGNGIRTTEGTISNSLTNLEINPGSETLEELIGSMKYGLIIDEFSWLNPSEVTGDFGSEIRNGYLIKKGKRSSPVKGGNLSGNIFEMINSIEGISKEQITESNYKFPYIKFSGLVLSS